MKKEQEKQTAKDQVNRPCRADAGAASRDLRQPPFSATISMSYIKQILDISGGLASKLNKISSEFGQNRYKSRVKLLVETVKVAQRRGHRAPQLRDFIFTHDTETVRLMAQLETRLRGARDVACHISSQMTAGEANRLASEIRQFANEIEQNNQGTT